MKSRLSILFICFVLSVSLTACEGVENIDIMSEATEDNSDVTSTLEESNTEEDSTVDSGTETTVGDVSSAEDTDYEHERVGFSQSGCGLIAEDDKGNIYYRSELDNWYLYKSKADGSAKTKICEDVADDINVLDDYIYYTNYKDNFNVYRIKTDGTERQKLVDTYCSGLRVTENYMYLCLRDEKNTSHVYRANLDGSNLELLISGMDIGTYYKGVLYLTDNEALYSYDLKTRERIMLLRKFTHYISADDDGVYFWLPNQGQYSKIDKEGKISVLQRGGSYYAKHKDKLYYVGYSKDGQFSECIYYLDLKTGKEVKLFQFSDEYYDRYGKNIGLTKQDIRAGKVDEKFLNEDNEIEGMADAPGTLHVIGDAAFMRAVFRECMDENRGKWDCLLKFYDDGGYEVFD